MSFKWLGAIGIAIIPIIVLLIVLLILWRAGFISTLQMTLGEIVTTLLTLIAIVVIPFYLIKHERKIQRDEKIRDEQIESIKNIISRLGELGSKEFYFYMNSIKVTFSIYPDIMTKYYDCLEVFKGNDAKKRDDKLKELLVLMSDKVDYRLDKDKVFEVWGIKN